MTDTPTWKLKLSVNVRGLLLSSNIHKALNPFKAPRAENISQQQRFSHCEFGETGLKKVEILSCVVVFLNQAFAFTNPQWDPQGGSNIPPTSALRNQ